MPRPQNFGTARAVPSKLLPNEFGAAVDVKTHETFKQIRDDGFF